MAQEKLQTPQHNPKSLEAAREELAGLRRDVVGKRGGGGCGVVLLALAAGLAYFLGRKGPSQTIWLVVAGGVFLCGLILLIRSAKARPVPSEEDDPEGTYAKLRARIAFLEEYITAREEGRSRAPETQALPSPQRSTRTPRNTAEAEYEAEYEDAQPEGEEAIDLSIPRACYFRTFDEDPGPCPRCEGVLFNSLQAYVTMLMDDLRGTETILVSSDAGWFCPTCPVVILHPDRFAAPLFEGNPSLAHASLMPLGLIDIDALPEGDEDELSEEELPFVEFTDYFGVASPAKHKGKKRKKKKKTFHKKKKKKKRR